MTPIKEGELSSKGLSYSSSMPNSKIARAVAVALKNRCLAFEYIKRLLSIN